MWVWCAFLAMTVQIQPWVSAGHSTAMSRLLGQGVLLFCLQVIHTQLLGSGVVAPSCSALSLRSKATYLCVRLQKTGRGTGGEFNVEVDEDGLWGHRSVGKVQAASL